MYVIFTYSLPLYSKQYLVNVPLYSSETLVNINDYILQKCQKNDKDTVVREMRQEKVVSNMLNVFLH